MADNVFDENETRDYKIASDHFYNAVRSIENMDALATKFNRSENVDSTIKGLEGLQKSCHTLICKLRDRRRQLDEQKLRLKDDLTRLLAMATNKDLKEAFEARGLTEDDIKEILRG